MPYYKKTSRGLSPGYHPYTPDDMKRVGWCFKKNIKIAVIPSGIDWCLEITLNDKVHLNPEKFSGFDALGKMYEYYKYYYDKYNK